MGDQAEKKKKAEEKKERPPLLETYQIIAGVTGNRYLVESMLGKGGFSEIYQVTALADREKKFAMRVEPNYADSRRKHMLRMKVEIHIFESIQKADDGLRIDKSNFVNMHDKGRTEDFKYYVMDLTWMSLKDAIQKLCTGVLTSHTKIIIARQTLKSIDTIHQLGFLHRDIKWHNFAVGLPPKDNIIYGLDFRIARPYREADGRVMIPRAKVPFMGTVKYASIRSMSFLEQCRKDDLESWLYMMLEVYDKKNLDWLVFDVDKQLDIVLRMKQEVMNNSRTFIDNGTLKIPKQYADIFDSVNKMKYTDAGDFIFFDSVLNTIARAEKIDEKLPLDWIGKKLPEEPKKEVTSKTKKSSEQTEDEDKDTMDDRLNKREKGRKRGKKGRDTEDEYWKSDTDDREDDYWNEEEEEERRRRSRRRKQERLEKSRDSSDDRRRRQRSSEGGRRDRKMSSSTEFALNLLRAASGHDHNYVISPFSLGAALAIVHDGAKEDTQKELTKLLGKTLSPSEISSLYSSLTSALSEKNSAVMTSVANRFFLDKKFSINSDYQSHIQKAYNAGAEKIDFKDGEASTEHINSFVNQNTGGMIKKLVSAGAFIDSVAVLINAVYFKGRWKTPFDKEATETKPFHGIAGKREAEFMIASNLNTRYSLNEDLAVVSLAYKDPSYSLVVLMPTGDFGVWRSNLTADKLQTAIDNLHTGKINLELPKFKVESTTDGKAALQKCGVSRIFECTANLKGISNEDLYLSKIVIKAVIDVSEEGTKAAAAMMNGYIAFGCAASPIDPPHIAINRPFLFLLLKDNNIVFLGNHV